MAYSENINTLFSLIEEKQKSNIFNKENDIVKLIWSFLYKSPDGHNSKSFTQNRMNELMAAIKDNPNCLSIPVYKKLVSDKIITKDLLESAGVNLDDPIYNIRELVNKIHATEVNTNIADKGLVIANLVKDFVFRSPQCQQASTNPLPNRVNEFLQAIQKDHNLVKSTSILTLLRSNIVTETQLTQIGIDKKFIDELARIPYNNILLTAGNIKCIERKSTEIYFWGIPSSGKTCALGTILSMASSGKMAAKSLQPVPGCQGWDYMNELITRFTANDDEIITLPPGTPLSCSYEMGFNLVDEKKRVHPVTFIDLAGEAIRCMYKANSNQPLNNDEQLALDTIDRLLINNTSPKDNNTPNQKLHFFVIEYGADAKLFGGVNQAVLLNGALAYIREKEIFEHLTDGIFLIITKADKVGLTGKALDDAIYNYIHTSNAYLGFGNNLLEICETKHINDGKLPLFPFSIGNVCFQDYCILDGKYSKRIIQKLVDRTWHYRWWETSKWWGWPFRVFFNIMKS